MRPWRGHLAVLAAAAVLVGAGCGSEEEKPGPGIPRESVSQLGMELDLVQKRLDVTRVDGKTGSCGDIDAKSYPDIRRLVDELPRDTDSDVRKALEKSIERLKKLTASECSDLVRKIKDRQESTTQEPAPLPEPAPQPTTPQDTAPEPQQTDTQPEKKPKKDKKPKDDGTGTNPGGTPVPGDDGGGQQAPLPNEG